MLPVVLWVVNQGYALKGGLRELILIINFSARNHGHCSFSLRFMRAY